MKIRFVLFFNRPMMISTKPDIPDITPTTNNSITSSTGFIYNYFQFRRGLRYETLAEKHIISFQSPITPYTPPSAVHNRPSLQTCLFSGNVVASALHI